MAMELRIKHLGHRHGRAGLSPLHHKRGSRPYKVATEQAAYEKGYAEGQAERATLSPRQLRDELDNGK